MNFDSAYVIMSGIQSSVPNIVNIQLENKPPGGRRSALARISISPAVDRGICP